MKTFGNIACVLGYFAMLFAIAHEGGFKAVIFVTIAACCASVPTALNMNDADEIEDEPVHDSCEGCKHNLGGGCCSINVEYECGEGNHELWEAPDE